MNFIIVFTKFTSNLHHTYMSLFNQTTLSPAEYVLKYSLIYLGMRKLQDEKVDKIKSNEDNE